VSAAMAKLEKPQRPFTIGVIGDSTGAAAGSWVVQVGQWVSATYDRPVTLHPWFLGKPGYGPTWAISDGPNAPVTIWNASASGQGVAYSRQHLQRMLPANSRPDLLFINHGHNLTSPPLVELAPFVRDVARGHSDAATVLMTQNRQTAETSEKHAERMEGLRAWATKFGYPLIDVWDAFNKADLRSLVDGTGVHPTVEGYRLWGDVVTTFLGKRSG